MSNTDETQSEDEMSQLEYEDSLSDSDVEDDDDVQAMMQGTAMLKIGSPNWKRRRFLKLKDDTITICHNSKKSFRKSKTFKVEDVVSVQEGCHSERLRSHDGFLPEEHCLTVVFKKNMKTLDLQCKSREEAQHWVCGIRTLQQRMNNMSHAQKLSRSLENHCSVEQQSIMAHQLRSILGDKLLTQPLNDESCESLPSPEELKEKILVKVKKEQVDQHKDKSKSEGKIKAEKEDRKVKSEVFNMSPELCDLVVYTRSVPFKNFSEAAKKLPNEMSSFTEKVALRHIKNSGNLFVQHNSQHLSRVYPSGFRLQSSNYDPQDMWNVGCQLVALNFQTDGEQMDLNRGRFLPNDRCGYVLKPSFLCQLDSEFNPENTGGGPGHNPTLLTIQIISAQQLPKPDNGKLNSIVDPQVWVEIHGVPIDNNKKKTERIDNNGFNPTWNEILTFTLHVPELVLVRFMVEDHDHHSKNDFLGQFTLPLTSMRTGYRHVRLLGADGSSLSPASLFIKVKVTPNYGSPKHDASPKA